MEDKIIAGYLRDFVEDYGYEALDEPEAFEHFFNYCILSTHIPSTFPIDDIHVGKEANPGLDGLAIVINEHLINSNEEVDFFAKHSGQLDVKFIFLQSKTGSKFEMGEIGNFIFAVKDFFKSDPAYKTNERVNRLRNLKNYIYERHSIRMGKNPLCLMYYGTTGKWENDKTLKIRIDSDIAEISDTCLFCNTLFIPFDSDKLRNLYRELKNKASKGINIDKHATLPVIEHVQEAYIGILPCKEYLKLITDDADGKMLNGLFYDNVRDFQGFNPVNIDIQKTLIDQTSNNRFGLLNNGITIVAKSLKRVGNLFNISDFQIVNGCQTSHVIYLNRDRIPDIEKIFIPIKLIVTDDIEVTNDIIKATNWQTELKKEAFESLYPFHKKLEEFYLNYDKVNERRIYYERRSKQYDNQPVSKNKIITLTAQINSFIAMFLNSPHSTHRYYGELLEAYNKRIFVDDHSPFPYYASGYGLYAVDRAFARKELEGKYKKFKYHILFLLKMDVAGANTPNFGSKEINHISQSIMDILWDERKRLDIFRSACDRIAEAIEKTTDKINADRLKVFTSNLASLPEFEYESGIVRYYNDPRGFGFIERPTGPDIFIHIRDVANADKLVPGQTVEFLIKDGRKGPEASRLRIL
jgi:cold shock CspA family protein